MEWYQTLCRGASRLEEVTSGRFVMQRRKKPGRGDEGESAGASEREPVEAGGLAGAQGPGPNHLVPAALRALRILTLLADRPNGVTAAEVGRLLGIPKAPAHNLMCTLRGEGFADRDDE